MTTNSGGSALAPMAGNAVLARLLDSFRARPGRAALPPAQLVAQYDTQLGAAVAGVGRANSAAMDAAARWQKAVQGDGLRAVVDAERVYTIEQCRHGEDPAPRTGPLYDHLVHGVHALYVAAYRAQVVAELRDDDVRAAARRAERLREQLDHDSDLVCEQIVQLLETARDRKDRRSYDRAVERREDWGAITSVFLWLCAPDQPWQRRGDAWPAGAAAAVAYDAETAITGTPGMFPPIEGTYSTGADGVAHGTVPPPPRGHGRPTR